MNAELPLMHTDLWKESVHRARAERDQYRQKLWLWRLAAGLLAVTLLLVVTCG